MTNEQEAQKSTDEVKQPAEQTRTGKETAEDAVITGKRHDHQQVYNQALESNPNRHTGSANLENPDNDDESIQVIDAGKVIAERDRRQSSKSKSGDISDARPDAAAESSKGKNPDQRPSYIQGLKSIAESAASPEEAQLKSDKFKKFYHLRKEAEGLAEATTPSGPNTSINQPLTRPSLDSGSESATRNPQDLQNEIPVRDESHKAETLAAIKTVIVQKGDTLWSIAKQHLGDDASDHDVNNRVKSIAEDNRISNPDKISPGQTLAILDHPPTETSQEPHEHPAPGSNYTVRKGDTLFGIAGKALGNNATEQQKRDYVLDIAGVNHLKNQDRIFSGQQLSLPIIGQVGEKAPPPELAPKPEPESAETPLPESTTDQVPEVNPKSPDVPAEVTESEKATSIESVNTEFLALAEKLGIATEELRDNLKEIQRRVDKGETTADDIEQTYKHVKRLLETESTAGLKEDDRRILAQQVIDHTARTKNIDQGHHNTCQVTALESRVYQRTPSHAARMVTDLALTGKYDSADGSTTVEMPVKAVDDESTDFPVRDGIRSYASELFQVCAVNIHYVNEGLGTKYVQKQVDKNSEDSEDTGERLYKKGEKEPFRKNPNLDDNALTEINKAITGEPDDGFVFCHATYVCGSDNGLTTVTTEADFVNKLRSLPSSSYPMIVGVHTANDPFWSDSNHGSAGGAGGKGGGGHFVSVRSFTSGPPPTVELDNQWGKRNDHDKLSVHQLFLAMHHPNEACRELEKDVLQCQSEGKSNPVLELDLLRLQLLQEPIKPSDVSKIDNKAISLLRQQCQRWQAEKQAGTFDLSEQKTTMTKYQEIINLSPKEGKIQLRSELEKGGFISHEEYVKLLVEYGKFTRTNRDVTEVQNQTFTRLLSELPRNEQFKMLDEILGIDLSEE